MTNVIAPRDMPHVAQCGGVLASHSACYCGEVLHKLSNNALKSARPVAAHSPLRGYAVWPFGEWRPAPIRRKARH